MIKIKKRERKRQINDLKMSKKEQSDRAFLKNQVKHMKLLKKIAETVKGQKITENCFQQEEDENLGSLRDDLSKSEMTQNQNSSLMD